MCKSDCTGLVSEFCSLGVIDFGQIYCMDCNSMGTKTWEKKELQKRFGDSWGYKYQELMQLKKSVKRQVRAGRRNGYRMAETVYFKDPPLNPELHADHMNLAGEHIRRPKNSEVNPQLEKLLNELRKDGRMPMKSYLADFGSHG